MVSKWEINYSVKNSSFLQNENPTYSTYVSTHTYEQEKGEEDGARLFPLVTVEVRITTFLNHLYCDYRICKRCGFSPWDRKTPWRRKWQPAPVFLPGESHGQRSLVGYSLWGHKESDTTEVTADTLSTCAKQGQWVMGEGCGVRYESKS